MGEVKPFTFESLYEVIILTGEQMKSGEIKDAGVAAEFIKGEASKLNLSLTDQMVKTIVDGIRNEVKVGKTKDRKTEENSIYMFEEPMLNLGSIKGRGEAFRILTEDFLNTFDPVITLADSGELRIYKDGVYSNIDGTSEYQISNYITEELAFREYAVCLLPSHTETIIKMIKAKTYTPRSKVDNDPFKLAVKNGILDVRTVEIKEFNPRQIFVSKVDVEYNPDVKPLPEFLEFLNSTFRGVEWQIPVIQELIGYCLYRAYPYEYLIFFTGDGRNGKGVLLQLVGKLVGKHNISSIPLDDIVRKRSEFTLCDLYDKMVNLCGEIGKTKIDETRDIKMLTGKDDVRARFPYQRSFTFRNHAKMFFSMNEPPEIEDFTAGMKNRIKLYDFPNEFITGVNAIENLEEILTTPEALTGMLNWALEGLHRLLKNKGKLSDHRTAAQMGLIYEKKSRPMYYFVRDCVEEDPSGMILLERLEEAYVKYTKKHNLPTLSKSKLKEKLTKECNDVGIKTGVRQIRKHQLNSEDRENEEISKRPRVYFGIRLLPEETEQVQTDIKEFTELNCRQGNMEDLSKYEKVRKEIILFANNGSYHGVVEDLDALVTDFMKANPGYKSDPGREVLTLIATKAKDWGWKI